MSASNKRSRGLVLYTTLFIGLLVVLFLISQYTSNKEDKMQTLAESPPISGQPVAGNAEAAVTIVEFGDYKCPSCKAWGEQVWPKLKEQYVDTEQVSFAYINTMFHGEESVLAAQASEVINRDYPDYFWDFHKALFDEQPTQTSHDDLWVTTDKLLEIAEATVPGLDGAAFIADMNADEIQRMIVYDHALVEKFDIQFTPTIVVNNILIENPFDYESIQQAIAQALD